MAENKDRQKTNSMTHMAKIIAREEIDRYHSNNYNDLSGRIGKLHVRMNALERERLHNIDISGFVDGVVNDLENAGTPWREEEDRMLQAELDIVLTHLAKRHGRTEVAIRSRLYQKGLTRKNCS